MTTARIDAPAALARARLAAIDAARGAAVAAMVVYHVAWDLSFHRLIAVDIASHPAWALFARAVAGSFLALVGVSLALADRNGIRPLPFLRRLAVIAAAALAITAVTWIVFPDRFIYFGILHAIAVSSVLGLVFLRLPVWTVAAAGIACLVAPMLFASPTFNAPAWRWLGLMTYFPATNDYVPLLPWFGYVLTGMAAARLALPRTRDAAWARWQPKGRASRAMVWAGRHSLAIYLLHQPALFGLLYAVAVVAGPSPAAERAGFIDSCGATCAATGADRTACSAYCACVADNLAADGLWRDVLDDRLDTDGQTRLASIARQCRALSVPD